MLGSRFKSRAANGHLSRKKGDLFGRTINHAYTKARVPNGNDLAYERRLAKYLLNKLTAKEIEETIARGEQVYSDIELKLKKKGYAIPRSLRRLNNETALRALLLVLTMMTLVGAVAIQTNPDVATASSVTLAGARSDRHLVATSSAPLVGAVAKQTNPNVTTTSSVTLAGARSDRHLVAASSAPLDGARSDVVIKTSEVSALHLKDPKSKDSDCPAIRDWVLDPSSPTLVIDARIKAIITLQKSLLDYYRINDINFARLTDIRGEAVFDSKGNPLFNVGNFLIGTFNESSMELRLIGNSTADPIVILENFDFDTNQFGFSNKTLPVLGYYKGPREICFWEGYDFLHNSSIAFSNGYIIAENRGLPCLTKIESGYQVDEKAIFPGIVAYNGEAKVYNAEDVIIVTYSVLNKFYIAGIQDGAVCWNSPELNHDFLAQFISGYDQYDVKVNLLQFSDQPNFLKLNLSNGEISPFDPIGFVSVGSIPELINQDAMLSSGQMISNNSLYDPELSILTADFPKNFILEAGIQNAPAGNFTAIFEEVVDAEGVKPQLLISNLKEDEVAVIAGSVSNGGIILSPEDLEGLTFFKAIKSDFPIQGQNFVADSCAAALLPNGSKILFPNIDSVGILKEMKNVIFAPLPPSYSASKSPSPSSLPLSPSPSPSSGKSLPHKSGINLTALLAGLSAATVVGFLAASLIRRCLRRRLRGGGHDKGLVGIQMVELDQRLLLSNV